MFPTSSLPLLESVRAGHAPRPSRVTGARDVEPRPPAPRPRIRAPALLLTLVLAATGALALAPPGAHAQDAPPPPPPERELEVWLLTIDRGDEVWEMFGHNALLIRDPATLQELAWNWGLFNFEDVDFIPRFLRGTMRYTMGPVEADLLLDSYARANRTIWANRVQLTPDQARELDAFVRWNFLPENRPYIYDYFRDNCSTRVRDALDRVLGGALHERFADQPTAHSWRWQARRMVQTVTWVDMGLNFLLGLRGDRAISAWEAMFLPVELMEHLETMEVSGPDGVMRPLLGPREVIFDAQRPPTPEGAPPFAFRWVILGLLGAALFLLAGGGFGGSERARRWVPTLGGFLWGAFTGLLGLILVSSWFTDHVFIHRNMNLLQASPLGLVLAGLLLALALRPDGWKGRRGQAALLLAATIAGLSVAGALLQLFPPLRQGNLEVLALAIPIHLGLLAAVAECRRTLPAVPDEAHSPTRPTPKRGQRKKGKP